MFRIYAIIIERVRDLRHLISINNCLSPIVCIVDAFSRENCLTERAFVVVLAPRFDAMRVEIVAFIAGQGSHHVCSLETFETNAALLVFSELLPSKHS